MRVNVVYAAQVKRAAGVASDEFELKGPCTVAKLLSSIVETRGESIRELLLDASGSPRKSLLLFVGDNQVYADAHVELRDGDTVTIMTPISGG
ncbi:MAG: MoaD/ThiS family protein [Planctomycetaceae bacterium]